MALEHFKATVDGADISRPSTEQLGSRMANCSSDACCLHGLHLQLQVLHLCLLKGHQLRASVSCAPAAAVISSGRSVFCWLHRIFSESRQHTACPTGRWH